MDQDELREHLTEGSIWIRGLFMLMFGIIYSIAEIVVFAVTLFQFFVRLTTGNLNPRLLDLGYSLSSYVYQIYLYLTFNSEERPYPFSPWPERESESQPTPISHDNDDDEPHLGV